MLDAVATFRRKVGKLLDILNDLDEYDTPKIKLPNCPRCDEDELGVIHAGLILCYSCRWTVEEKRGARPPLEALRLACHLEDDPAD